MNHIVLFEPEKPANVGNIIRTCMAMNAELIIVGDLSFELSDKSLKRAGMDYMIGFKIIRYKNLDEFYLDHEKDLIFYITRYSSSLYSKRDYSDVAKDYYFMFGRESTGIPYDILHNNLDHCFRIPTTDKIRSLNLSNCAAIMLFVATSALNEDEELLHHEPECFKGENFIDNWSDNNEK